MSWVAGWLVLMIAAVKANDINAAPHRCQPQPLDCSARPAVLPLIMAAVIALIIQIVTGYFEPFLIYTAATIGVLVISRQIVDLIETHQLNTQIGASAQGSPRTADRWGTRRTPRRSCRVDEPGFPAPCVNAAEW